MRRRCRVEACALAGPGGQHRRRQDAQHAGQLMGVRAHRLVGLGIVVAAGLLSYGLTGQLIGAFNLRALRPARWRNAAK